MYIVSVYHHVSLHFILIPYLFLLNVFNCVTHKAYWLLYNIYLPICVFYPCCSLMRAFGFLKGCEFHKITPFISI